MCTGTHLPDGSTAVPVSFTRRRRGCYQSAGHYDKASAALPTTRLNRLERSELLALITCGGEFVGAPLGYADNVIAWATPA